MLLWFTLHRFGEGRTASMAEHDEHVFRLYHGVWASARRRPHKCVLFFSSFFLGGLSSSCRKVWPHAAPCLPFTWNRCVSLNDGQTDRPLRRRYTVAGAEFLGYFPNSSLFFGQILLTRSRFFPFMPLEIIVCRVESNHGVVLFPENGPRV